MYVDAFPDKPLVQELEHPAYVPIPGKDLITIRDARELISYLVSKGVWLKMNGLGNSWDGNKDPYVDDWVIEYFDAYYPKVKVMIENLALLDALKSALKRHISYWNRGCEWEGLSEMKIGSKENKEMIFYFYGSEKDRYHISVEEEKKLWRHMARHIGYRFVLKELRYPEEVKAEERFHVRYEWKNKGSAPCYKDYAMLLALVDTNGHTVWEDVQLPGIATSSLIWDAGCTVEDAISWIIPQKVKSGIYNLYVGMRDIKHTEIGIEIAIAGKDTQKRYKVGTIRIVA